MTDGTNQQHTVVGTGKAADFPTVLHDLGGGTIATIVFTVVGGILWLRRRLSRDNLELAKDDSERRLMCVITEERDRAVASAEVAWATRTEDARLIGELTSEVKHLNETNRNLIADVSGLREEIGNLREIIYTFLPPDIAERMRNAATPPYSRAIRDAITGEPE